MKRYCFALLTASFCAFAEEKRVVTHIEEKDLPAAVRQAAKKDVPPGAKNTGFEKLIVDGQDFFEVKIEVAGQDQELLYRPNGQLFMREEETTIDKVPAAARAAIQKAAAAGTIRKVDVMRMSNRVLYEGELLIKGEKSKVVFDAQGMAQKP